MKSIIRKVFLLGLFLLSLATLLLTWQNHPGVQTINGIVVLSGNLILSALITGMYFVGVIFFEKAPKTMLCMGFSGLSMLFALYCSKFEAYGRFSNKCIGPYLGVLSVAITIAVYLLLTTKAFHKEYENNAD